MRRLKLVIFNPLFDLPSKAHTTCTPKGTLRHATDERFRDSQAADHSTPTELEALANAV